MGLAKVGKELKRNEVDFMHCLDINPENKTIILLIHPMLSSAEGMRQCIVEGLKGQYRFLIPDLSSHGESQESYHSAREEAKKLRQILIDKGVRKINLAYAASLGAVVLLYLIEYKELNFQKCIFEGAPLWQNSFIMEFFFKKIMLSKHRMARKNRALSIAKMKKMFGEKASEKMTDTFIHMDEESIKNIIYDCAHVQIPKLSKEEQKICIFCYGDRESDLKGAKKFLPKFLPYAHLIQWKGYGHCERIVKDSIKYGHFLEEQIEIEDEQCGRRINSERRMFNL